MNRPRGALATAALAVFVSSCGALVGLTGDYRDVSGGAGGGVAGGSTRSTGPGGGTASGGGGRGNGGNGGNGGSPPICAADAECQPGEFQRCSKCGTRVCQLPDCKFGACQNQGACDPGTTQDCPGGCSQRICLDSCVWCGCGGAACGDCSPSTTNPWLGCGSTGCAICPDEVTAYPCYFENHPGCKPEVGCGATESACSDLCPQPTSFDACTCTAPPQGWHGCGASGCDVCSSKVAGYACYFYNHPQCTRDDTCGGGAGKCSGHCPPPSSADLPGM